MIKYCAACGIELIDNRKDYCLDCADKRTRELRRIIDHKKREKIKSGHDKTKISN